MPPPRSSCRYSGAPACRSAPVRGGRRGWGRSGRLSAVGSRWACFDLGNLVVSGVDPRDSGRRQRDAFGWQPLRDHEIGMRLTDQTMVGLADCAEGGSGQHAENRIGIFGGLRSRAGVEGPNAGVFRRLEAKMPGDFGQVIVLGAAETAIGEGDVKKAAEKVLEHRPIIREQPADLSSVALEPGGALPGKIEDEPDVLLFVRRHLKDLAEGGD